MSEEEREAFFSLEHLRVDKALSSATQGDATSLRESAPQSYHDRRTLSVLCSLHESLSWVGHNILSRSRSFSATPTSTQIIRRGCEQLAERCDVVSRRALIGVRMLYRWRCGSFINTVTQEHFMRYSVPIEVDPFVVGLCKYLTSTDYVLSRFLSPKKQRCLPPLICF